MRIYRVLTVCGTGIATSSHIAMMVQKGLETRGIQVQVRTCSIMEASGVIGNYKPDVIVPTISLASVKDIGDIKVILGVALLTGIGTDKLLDEIAACLKE